MKIALFFDLNAIKAHLYPEFFTNHIFPALSEGAKIVSLVENALILEANEASATDIVALRAGYEHYVLVSKDSILSKPE